MSDAFKQSQRSLFNSVLIDLTKFEVGLNSPACFAVTMSSYKVLIRFEPGLFCLYCRDNYGFYYFSKCRGRFKTPLNLIQRNCNYSFSLEKALTVISGFDKALIFPQKPKFFSNQQLIFLCKISRYVFHRRYSRKH